ncbi:UDP-glucose--hexose-1-phosphate uridylyltransferase [Acidaminobacter sp. JC074]|uniref:UDP-glucose--hexose-1-phosphate uridylyltransferase n=1 Tax=Acidaminobacter sp. JC074 TaxID=2530199 RepID=UPI001F105FB6|nr:UDP-glucose--hexose-1-phosphate uridylyltransferase [Acidaminobacter sp. JC074]MCH4886818.1 UDP-glucose--hexose-1-phosphate uridylyltransferase [Acidaminobacter sp. JC074]
MTIYEAVEGLCGYAVENGLIDELDRIYCRNQILELMGLTSYDQALEVTRDHFKCLSVLVEDAFKRGIIESDKPPYSDLFESRVMNVFMPKPSQVIKEFKSSLAMSPEKATEYFYDLSKKSHYIRLDRTSKNLLWQVETDFGLIDITVNLSKPEKDPKAIAAALNKVENNYPKCLLCKENEGYSGHVNHPGRQNHRIVPLSLNKESWYFQYSPYAYFNEHSILLKSQHENMTITHDTFTRLMDFLDTFPHYFIGSNADLPLVGGSLLTHDHYQAGRYEFAMECAETLETFDIEGVEVSHMKWPLTVLRLRDLDRKKLEAVACKIFDAWKDYSDEAYRIVSFTSQRHNTVTPIARKKNGYYELDLVLRNNRCDDESPTGIFHPHTDVHAVKKENIGLIEVMGLAVLPSRLVGEMDNISKALMKEESLSGDLEKFSHLFEGVKAQATFEETLSDVKSIIGKTFVKGLVDAGVFKLDENGYKGLKKFIESI